MNRRQYAIVVSFSISLMAAALVPLSGQQGSSYNPWLDYNGDGIIDVEDLHALGSVYGTSGTPLNQPMALEYDSGWLDISDKMGQNITIAHNLHLTRSSLPNIWGKTTPESEPHQRYFEGTGNKPGWNKTYGGATIFEYAKSVVKTADGGYALAGYTSSNSNDLWLVKTDSAGNQQWNRTYGGTGNDQVWSMVQTTDGGYALAGYTTSYGASNNDFWLVKTDSLGYVQWNKTYGGPYFEQCYSVVQTSDGGYALAGRTNSYGIWIPTYPNFWLVKTDSAGNHQWNNTYGGQDSDYARSVIQTADGGYAVAGATYSNLNFNDILLVKTDSTGNYQWNNTFGGPTDQYAHSLIQTIDSAYALTGYTRLFGSYDFLLLKIDSAGAFQWNKIFEKTATDDVANSVFQTSDRGYALAGYLGSQPWLVKIDSAGNHLWNRTYGTKLGKFYSVVQTSDGGYTLTGDLTPTMGYTDFWLVKTDVYGLTQDFEIGLGIIDYTSDTIILYRGAIDYYWNYVQVRIWVVKENP